jgi:hypothetical protein
MEKGDDENVSSKASMKELFEPNEFYTDPCP